MERRNPNTNATIVNSQKMEKHRTYRAATTNIRGLKKLGKRELLETWAEHRNLDIVLIQETHINQTAMERRSKYTIFSADKPKNRKHSKDPRRCQIGNSLHSTALPHLPPRSGSCLIYLASFYKIPIASF